MCEYIQVAEFENEEPIELPLEEDFKFALSTLNSQFPGAIGLKFRSDAGGMRGVRLFEGTMYPPDGDDGFWGTRLYICSYPKGADPQSAAFSDNKRKIDENVENSASKTKRLQMQKCTDLIVLGLPWKTAEDGLKEYFTKFGELLVAQIKADTKGQSKGYGFIRFADYEVQKLVMAQRHLIDGRWCDVSIPHSRGAGENIQQYRKVFVGRVTESLTQQDLLAYFTQFGEVVDVYLPKPFRAFAFVTFADGNIAKSLCGEDHIINGVSVNVSSAEPKNHNPKPFQTHQGMRQESLKSHASAYGNMRGASYGQAAATANYGYGSPSAIPISTDANQQGNITANIPGLGNIQLTPALLAAALSQSPWMLQGQQTASPLQAPPPPPPSQTEAYATAGQPESMVTQQPTPGSWVRGKGDNWG